jgi:hypothetical protein
MGPKSLHLAAIAPDRLGAGHRRGTRLGQQRSPSCVPPVGTLRHRFERVRVPDTRRHSGGQGVRDDHPGARRFDDLQDHGLAAVDPDQQTTGKTVTLNVSGPGTVTYPPNSTLGVIASHGVSIYYVTNGAQFGLPNLMYVSGLFDFTTDFANDTIVSVARPPHVLLDVCAALA